MVGDDDLEIPASNRPYSANGSVTPGDPCPCDCLRLREALSVSIALMAGYAYEVSVWGPHWLVLPVERFQSAPAMG